MERSSEAENAAEVLTELLARVRSELERRGVPDQALAELRQPKSVLGFRRKPVMAPISRAWRLGVLLLDREGALFAVGSVTRAVAPLHANNQSQSQEERREIRRAAFDGPFREGEVVNYGWRRLSTSADGLRSGQEPLVLRGADVLVRWAPGLGDQGLMPAERYLTERLELLDAP